MKKFNHLRTGRGGNIIRILDHYRVILTSEEMFYHGVTVSNKKTAQRILAEYTGGETTFEEVLALKSEF